MLELTGAAEAFGRHLVPQAHQPLAVACSGGGDSVAALLAAKAWADVCGRRIVVLHVDHGLQAQSGAWRDVVAGLAERLGCGFQSFAWRGEKPSRGLAAAARQARHALIADGARAAGARVVILGHTLDDRFEAQLMRAEGSTLGRLAPWGPSPIWPQGRGLFLLRPLLSARRADIRRALIAAGETWIEDPANADMGSPRARARQRLASGAGSCAAPRAEAGDEAALARAAEIGGGGTIRIDRGALRAASAPAARRFVSAAALCAGGGMRPPKRARVEALLARLRSECDVAATLAGARVAADAAVLFARDAGERARGGLAPVALVKGEASIWDGRFDLRTTREGLGVAALKGRAVRLPGAERAALKTVTALARGALPLVTGAGAQLTCPILAREGGVEARFLGGDRLLAACGAILKEPQN